MSRDISTDLNILARPAEWEQVAAELPAALGKAGYDVGTVHGEIVDLTCEPDNMLLAQYAQEQGRMPITEVLYRVIINGSSGLDLRAATAEVVAALPADTYWYGTSREGSTTPGIGAACAWQDRS
ncbi:MAG: hypothetical protein Q4G50_12130 [Corynebacterium sp.]|uniref:hypothetical protein n=1 Tax=Corynebacterium sp. TaxID=1720 RepID=UPI0026E06090|nr:hypothetical protein [Corynebacterium sp.]MDO5670732.1 hypothetical protein [Corynebacterium sp.]